MADAAPLPPDTPAHDDDDGAQLSDALLAALRGVVPKADVYLIKAAQAST
jgi:hypothetical protein